MVVLRAGRCVEGGPDSAEAPFVRLRTNCYLVVDNPFEARFK